MTAKLFTMTQVNRLTGERVVLYGRTTENVISQYWEAYVTSETYVEVDQYFPTKPEVDLSNPV